MAVFLRVEGSGGKVERVGRSRTAAVTLVGSIAYFTRVFPQHTTHRGFILPNQNRLSVGPSSNGSNAYPSSFEAGQPATRFLPSVTDGSNLRQGIIFLATRAS
jgi:hypothetical protein